MSDETILELRDVTTTFGGLLAIDDVSASITDGETVGRYYHVYDPDEFERDIDASALARVESFESGGNCYAVVRGARPATRA